MKHELKNSTQNTEDISIEEPSNYKVYLLNDDVTTMDFVMLILQQVFHKPIAEAEEIMLEAHATGKGLCGEYTFEIAETKVHLVHEKSRQVGFPLRCIME